MGFSARKLQLEIAIASDFRSHIESHCGIAYVLSPTSSRNRKSQKPRNFGAPSLRVTRPFSEQLLEFPGILGATVGIEITT